MISYHPESPSKPLGSDFTRGFVVMPWHRVDMVAKTAATYAWAPIIWKDGYRRTENFQVSHWVGLDFDCSELSLEQALNDFCDMIHVIGTTRNHQVEKGGVKGDRFRVILRWDRPITDAQTYKYNMKRLIRKYDADKACSDPARHFFACKEIVSVCGDGYSVDQEEMDPDYIKKQEIKLKAKRRCGILSPLAQRLLTTKWEQFTKNNNVFYLGCEFARCGVSYEDAIARILGSPEYAHRKVPPELYEEIASAVMNGFRTESTLK